MSILDAASPTEITQPAAVPEGPAREKTPRHIWVQGFIMVGLLLLAQVPLLNKFFQDLWSREEYQFFPIAILAAAYLAWDRLREVPLSDKPRSSLLTTAPILLLGFLFLCGGLLYLRLMGAISTWLVLAAIAWWAGGWRLVKAMLPAGILLLIIIPPPGHWDDAIGARLRLFAVHASSRVLDALGVPNDPSGTVIDIPGHKLLIEEACSGINSMMSVIAFALLYGFWSRKRAWVVGLLTAAGIGFVLCANIVRITFGAVLVHYWQIDILAGTPHALLGMVLFGLSAGVLVSFDHLLVLLGTSKTVPETSAPDRSAKEIFGKLFASASRGGVPGKAIWGLAVVAFLALGVVLQARIGNAWPHSRVSDSAVFSMPAQIGSWQRVEGQGVLGRPETDSLKSSFWVYRSGDLTAAVAFAYPFNGFHDATICYRRSGWDTLSSREFSTTTASQGGLFEVRMSQWLSKGLLFFGLTDETGRTVLSQPPIPPGAGRLETAMALSREKALASPAYGVQVLTEGFDSLNDEQISKIRSLFLAARQELARQVVQQVEANK